ncbi:MAG: pyridoxal-phosphate dependent enzyme [Promethearchaeota archaeon]|nr:MAG: pyridoxal-phosphate dependent enzyme [Candidatus Lokiarchaeota archaeon]
MKRDNPVLFEYYPKLKENVPWTSILTKVPTPVDKLKNLEDYFGIQDGHIYIKRDDLNHHIYGGNKLRKFEFIFGDILEKQKEGVITTGGVGTNHGLACAVVCNCLDPPLNYDLFLFPQPLTWHVQRSLLLFDYFGANLHLGKGDISSFLKALGFQITHPKYYLILPGGSPLFGFGTILGSIGFINAILELKMQIENEDIKTPDAIFVATGSTGTASGLAAGIKLFDLGTKLYAVAVYDDFITNPKAILRNGNKAIRYLRKFDKSLPNVTLQESDFEFVKGYLGSGYGIKTLKCQNAVDLITGLEGKEKGFKLDTTYTGKAAASMIDFLNEKENRDKNVLFWNTYNSNDLDNYLREIGYDYKALPKEFHRFFEEQFFQCWLIESCTQGEKEKCPVYMNHEYRCWKIKNCPEDIRKNCKKYEYLKNVIKLED